MRSLPREQAAAFGRALSAKGMRTRPARATQVVVRSVVRGRRLPLSFLR